MSDYKVWTERELEGREDEFLLSQWATKNLDYSRFRKEKEEETHRTRFRRDRDRILYTTGFRRLQYKTQVLVNYAGDHHRTRLTHTLEVKQIAASIAEAVGANKTLTEAIALGHDIGHTPFGHAVERVLNEKLKDYGGFSHAVQSVRYLQHIKYHSEKEKREGKEGLNLSKQVLEGILKHDSDVLNMEFNTNKKIHQWKDCSKLSPSEPGSLEAQIVYWADKIAYLSHDWDDFDNFGLKKEAEKYGRLKDNEMNQIWETLIDGFDNGKNLETRDIIRNLCNKLIDHSMSLLNKYKPESSKDVVEITKERIKANKNEQCKYCKKINIKKLYQDSFLINFPDDIRETFFIAKDKITNLFYKNTVVARMDDKAQYIIERIYDKYVEKPNLLPLKTRQTIKEKKGRFPKERIIADHIAGMTDRYANKIYKELFLPGGDF